MMIVYMYEDQSLDYTDWLGQTHCHMRALRRLCIIGAAKVSRCKDFDLI